MVEVKNRAIFDSRRKELTATRVWVMNEEEATKQVKTLMTHKKHAEGDIKRLNEQISNIQELTEQEIELQKSLEKIKNVEKLPDLKGELETAEKALKYINEDLGNFQKAIGNHLKFEEEKD